MNSKDFNGVHLHRGQVQEWRRKNLLIWEGVAYPSGVHRDRHEVLSSLRHLLMDMFVLVVVGFDFQTGEIDSVPAGDLDREGAAFGAGGIGFENLEFFAAGGTTGSAGGGCELQFRLAGNCAGGHTFPVELDRLGGGIRERPDGYSNVRDTPGMGFPGMDEDVFEQIFG